MCRAGPAYSQITGNPAGGKLGRTVMIRNSLNLVAAVLMTLTAFTGTIAIMSVGNPPAGQVA